MLLEAVDVAEVVVFADKKDLYTFSSPYPHTCLVGHHVYIER